MKLSCLLLGAVLGTSSLSAFADYRADGFGEVIDRVELARIEAQERRRVDSRTGLQHCPRRLAAKPHCGAATAVILVCPV